MVGMRFYNGSYDSLLKKKRAFDFDQESNVYILPEANNTYDRNAIMVSDGRRKVGSIAAVEAAELRVIFEKMRAETGYDEVLVAKLSWAEPVRTSYEADRFKKAGSLRLRVIGRVHERLARKFEETQA